MKNMTLDDKPTTFDIQRAIRGSAAIRNFFGVEKKDEEEEDMTRAEAAKELGISEKTVSCYMTNGVLKSGGWGVVDDSSVVAFKAKPKKEKLKAALPVKTKEQDPAKLDTIRALISKAYFAGYDDGYSDGQSNSLSIDIELILSELRQTVPNRAKQVPKTPTFCHIPAVEPED